jgi:hypothetical protein
MKNSRTTDVMSTIQTLQQCIEVIHKWCASRRLQLNPSKTEVIWFGTKATVKKMENSDLSLHVGNDVIEPVPVVRDLGVFLDSELTISKETCQQSSKCVLLPLTSTEANSTHPRQADNHQSGQRIRPKSVGLLQLCVGRAAEVNHRSIAACSECCREIDLWSRSARSRDSGIIRAALASCRATCDV